jgi:TetR/AcrR family transcriptional regulator, cholesterol catabolism regulator
MTLSETGTPAVTRPREAELRRAATRLFRERGFHATSMQDLAEAMGMNRGSLYHYIESKDDLLWGIVSDTMDRLRESVEPVLAGDGPAADRLRGAIRAHLAFAAEYGDEMSLVQVELRSLSADRHAQLVGERDAYEGCWRAVIAEAVEEGAVRAMDVRLTGIAILSACNWFTQWFRPDGALGVDEIAASFADLFLCPACD